MLLDHILNAGPVAILLLVLSVLAFALLVERLWVQMSYPFFVQKEFTKYCQMVRHQEFSKAEACLPGKPRVSKKPHGWKAAIVELLKARLLDNDLRQQISVEWLENEHRYLNTRLRLVGLIGAIAPLLGLLGTVFGIIEMFKAIAHSTGPVTPALLAEGMWTAMVTTALGLVIAIPALAASHGLEQLSQARVQKIQDILNELNLVLLGKDVDEIAHEPVEQSSVRETEAVCDTEDEQENLQSLPLAGTA